MNIAFDIVSVVDLIKKYSKATE